MNYAQLRNFDIANGPFVRTTLFVSGCMHDCENCFNKEYQNFKYGNIYNNETENEILLHMKDNNIKGFSLLGGEPFQQLHGYELDNLLKRIKMETNKSIWVWTGYTFEEILNDNRKIEFLKNIDVLVDGKFIEELKDIKLKFRGSSNQRIIDVQESLINNKIVEKTCYY